MTTGTLTAAKPVRVPTRTALSRLRAVLLAGTLVMLVTSVLAVRNVLDTAEVVRDRTTQAVLETAAARNALISADNAAITSFYSGDSQLAGPGREYENQMTVASQSLARVAEFNQAGEAGASALEVVEGLVAAYSGSIGQADAHYRRGGGALIGTADLWYASRLLHELVGVLTDLQTLQRQALDRQIAADGMSQGVLPLWLLPPATLLVLLVLTQVFLGRRFRRVLNVPLIAASLLTIGIVAALGWTLVLAQRLDEVRDRTDVLLADRQADIVALDARGKAMLVALLKEKCGYCGVSVDTFVAGAPRGDAVPGDPARITEGASEVATLAGSATRTGGLPVFVSAAALADGVLILLGLYARIDEYRYRA
ncbi:hypothetical protein [Amycolatopsis samaneae]|uniref:Integral membrane protein n=1 Tax=Amycolatopsis samaneae TaxID=664691 RepID=A0ABW5GU93_9PSEU